MKVACCGHNENQCGIIAHKVILATQGKHHCNTDWKYLTNKNLFFLFLTKAFKINCVGKVHKLIPGLPSLCNRTTQYAAPDVQAQACTRAHSWYRSGPKGPLWPYPHVSNYHLEFRPETFTKLFAWLTEILLTLQLSFPPEVTYSLKRKWQGSW